MYEYNVKLYITFTCNVRAARSCLPPPIAIMLQT